MITWTLGKINYHIQTDAVKNHIIPQPDSTKETEWLAYAEEVDLLNVALFGKTVQTWQTENPERKGNIRDFASIGQLVILTNMESINTVLKA